MEMDRGEDAPAIPKIDSVEVRTLTRADLPEVTAVMNEGFGSKRCCGCIPASETVAGFVARYAAWPDEKLRLGAVAIIDNKIVGCVQMTKLGFPVYPAGLHTCESGEMYVETVSVGAAARGKGVGSRLMQWCEATARADPTITHLKLAVLYGNRAMGLYEKIGYKKIEEDACDFCCGAFFVALFIGRPYGCCNAEWGIVDMVKQLT
mmetsp:Transcript_15959/g.38835  ORF Transcript_15959/g.38835 Transcript_15959/m.38835 type:complete len:206 (+) Transcript_15959:163-780(+)